MLEQPQENSDRPLGWTDILVAVDEHRLLGIAATLLVTLAALVWALLTPDVYTAEVSMLPRSQSSLPGVLNAFPGVRDALEGNDANFEEFYEEIAKSDRVLRPILERTWDWSGGDPALLADIFELTDDDAAHDAPEVLERVKRHLRRSVIDLQRDDMDGFMRLRCSVVEDPVLAASLANAIADGLNSFNLTTSQQRAQQQREFIGQRLIEVQAEVQQAEDAITEFVSSHRGYLESPELLQRHRELQREADAATTMWVELRRQHELSRVEEQRNLNSLTILDQASPPVKPSGPNRPFVVGLGLFFGIVIGLVLILVKGFVWPALRDGGRRAS